MLLVLPPVLPLTQSTLGFHFSHMLLLFFNSLIYRPNDAKYSLAEVTQHDGRNGARFWITYKDGVYDITDFIKDHPGGRFVEQAGGGKEKFP